MPLISRSLLCADDEIGVEIAGGDGDIDSSLDRALSGTRPLVPLLVLASVFPTLGVADLERVDVADSLDRMSARASSAVFPRQGRSEAIGVGLVAAPPACLDRYRASLDTRYLKGDF